MAPVAPAVADTAGKVDACSTQVWVPVDKTLPKLDLDYRVTPLQLALQLSFAFEQRTDMLRIEDCCWVVDGRPPFLQLIMYGPKFDVIASRVLCKDEYNGPSRTHVQGWGIMPGVVIREYFSNTHTDSLYWRSWGNGPYPDYQTAHLGAIQAAPLDYQWQVVLRRKVRTYGVPDE